MTQLPAKAALLKQALKSNSLFSAISGVILIAAAGPLSQWIGIPQTWLVAGLGAGLILFAAEVFRHAIGPYLGNAETKMIIGLDVGWVAASAGLLMVAPNLLSPIGNGLVAAVAAVVAGLAAAQYLGLIRIERTRQMGSK